MLMDMIYNIIVPHLTNAVNTQKGVESYIFLSFSIAFFSILETYDLEIPSFSAVSL